MGILKPDPDKTIFISYRRDTSKYVARAIFMDLRANGYDVFMDVANVDSGTFDRIILNQIAARAHFLVILTTGSVERCAEPDDWLRREIETAIDLERNVVPVLVEDFSFPQADPYLTGKLAELKRYNALRLVHDYFDEAMERLRSRYLKQPVYGEVESTPPEDWEAILNRIDEAAHQPEPTERQLQAERHLDQGNALCAKGQYREAVAAYDEAIRLNPEHAVAYHMRGNAHIAQTKIEQAIADYTQAIRLNPNLILAYRNRGALYTEWAEWDQAIADYSVVIRLDPTNTSALLQRGAAYYHKGDYQRSLADDNEIINTLPLDWVGYNNRGETYFALGAYPLAFADFSKAVALGPDQKMPVAGLAITCHALGEVEEAKKWWRGLVEADANYLKPPWVRDELHWVKPLVNEARKLIAALQNP